MTLWQADFRWGGIKCGGGPSTLGRGGCLVTCLTEAARLLTGRTTLLPPHVNNACIRAKAFDWQRNKAGDPILNQESGKKILGDNLILDAAAKLYGLECPLSERVVVPLGEDRKPLVDSLTEMLRRGYAIVHVDHDSTTPGGDLAPDHFILATGIDGHGVVCADPALARSVDLYMPNLDNPTLLWGKIKKHYRAVAVRPIRLIAS